MTLDQLEQLDAIARAGTLTGAAAALRISQPALTRSIQRLEAEVGQSLLERRGRSVALNAAGLIALNHARRILEDMRQLRGDLDEHARRARAVRVGTVAPAPLWRLTALLIERFPQMVLTSEMLDAQDVERGVLNGTLDLGIAAKPCVLPTVRCHPLMTEHLFVSLPPGHRLSDASALHARDLDGETFLLYQGIGMWHGFCDRLFPHSGFVIQEDREVFERMLSTTPLPYFTSDAPSHQAEMPGRATVALLDAAAHATYYLLVRSGARTDVAAAFDWAQAQ